MLRISLIFLWNLIKENPLKMVYIIVAIVSYNYMFSFKYVRDEKVISEIVKVDNKYYDVYYGDTDESSIPNLQKQNGKLIVKDGVKKRVSYRSDYLGNMFLVFFIACLALIVACFFWDLFNGNLNDDNETWFGLSKVTSDTLSDSIRCVYENDTYYYLIFDRLIMKYDKMINNGSLPKVKLSSLRKYPKYKTVSEKRNYLIDKLIG